jgi:VWFA-related protein
MRSLSALVLWLALAADQAVFRTQVDSVLLDVFVTERGEAVTNLRAADFVVKDNGTVQPLTHVSGEAAGIAMYLAFDTSGSLTTRELANLRLGATELARVAGPEDSLRLITFTDVVSLHGEIGTGTAGLDSVFSKITPGGDTALHDALGAALHLADQPGTRRPVVIVFSDGADTASWLDAQGVDQIARRSWASVFAISPRRPEDRVLPNLAELTGGQVIVLGEDLAALPKALLQILDRLRRRYLLAFTPSSSTPGWHDLDVAVKRPNVKVVARQGYTRR